MIRNPLEDTAKLNSDDHASGQEPPSVETAAKFKQAAMTMEAVTLAYRQDLTGWRPGDTYHDCTTFFSHATSRDNDVIETKSESPLMELVDQDEQITTDEKVKCPYLSQWFADVAAGNKSGKGFINVNATFPRNSWGEFLLSPPSKPRFFKYGATIEDGKHYKDHYKGSWSCTLDDPVIKALDEHEAAIWAAAFTRHTAQVKVKRQDSI